MDDRACFLAALAAAPDDDLLRLVFADWLDDNAASDLDVATAEFIRVECSGLTDGALLAAAGVWLDANDGRIMVISQRSCEASSGAAHVENPSVPWDQLQQLMPTAAVGRIGCGAVFVGPPRFSRLCGRPAPRRSHGTPDPCRAFWL